MKEYTNSRDINHRSIDYLKKTSAANAGRTDSITSMFVKKDKHTQKCKSINTLDGDGLLDNSEKRHFCRGMDRIAHELKCVTQLQKIIEYYNRCELSSFQLGLKMDD